MNRAYSHLKSDSGYMLLEIIISVAIASIALVFLTSRISTAISGSRVSEERAQATRLAQGAAEWLKGWRDDVGWAAFTTGSDFMAGNTTVTLCWSNNFGSSITEPFTQSQFNQSKGICNPAKYINGLFNRYVVLQRSGNTVKYTVRVDWRSGKLDRKVELQGELRQGGV